MRRQLLAVSVSQGSKKSCESDVPVIPNAYFSLD